MQADIIKIDGVFVKDIVTNTLDAMIVRSITDLAKAKSLSVVAEFVETPQQQALLHKLGVQYLQGYLIGCPQPLADNRRKKAGELSPAFLCMVLQHQCCD